MCDPSSNDINKIINRLSGLFTNNLAINTNRDWIGWRVNRGSMACRFYNFCMIYYMSRIIMFTDIPINLCFFNFQKKKIVWKFVAHPVVKISIEKYQNLRISIQKFPSRLWILFVANQNVSFFSLFSSPPCLLTN